MAARRTAVTRRRRSSSPVRRVTRRVSGLGGGKFGPIIQGLIGGVASQVGSKFLPGYGGILGIGATGYLMNNTTLLTLAGMQAGATLSSVFLGGSPVTNGGGTI